MQIELNPVLIDYYIGAKFVYQGTKLMMRGVVATLIAGAAVTSLASDVCAQSIERNQERNSNATLSGASLSGIQSRSIAKDFPRAASRASLSSSRGNGINQTSGPDALTGLLGDVGKRLEFGGVSDGSFNSQSGRSPFLSDLANGDSDSGVKVRYRLNNK